MRHKSHEAGMFLEPARAPQAFHRTAIVFGADVALGAVFGDDVGEARRHDENGQAGGGAPVIVDAVGGVEGVGLEVDEAAVLGPYAGHAVAGLVGPEGSVERQRVSIR